MLIAFEGIDGAGKATCIERVCERLSRQGCRHRAISFPQYGKTASASVVTAILNRRIEGVTPYFAAAAFAMDRCEARSTLEDPDGLVLCDRYVASNAAFQAARLPEPERAGFLDWVLDLEFARFGVPKPALTVLLDIPPDVAFELISRKAKRSYTDAAYDAYEADRAFQAEVAGIYRHLAADGHAGRWQVVPVCDGDRLRTPDEIADDAFARIMAVAGPS